MTNSLDEALNAYLQIPTFVSYQSKHENRRDHYNFLKQCS